MAKAPRVVTEFVQGKPMSAKDFEQWYKEAFGIDANIPYDETEEEEEIKVSHGHNVRSRVIYKPTRQELRKANREQAAAERKNINTERLQIERRNRWLRNNKANASVTGDIYQVPPKESIVVTEGYRPEPQDN